MIKSMITMWRLPQLLVYSLIPALGVLFLGWDWKEILLLYWLENITIGLQAVIDIIRTKAHSKGLGTMRSSKSVSDTRVIKLILIIFFAVHYGTFTLAHGLFVIILIAGVAHLGGDFGAPIDSASVYSIIGIWLLVSVSSIIRRTKIDTITTSVWRSFWRPYARIIPLHCAIVAGVFAISYLGLPSIAALVLIALKLIVDVGTFYLSRANSVIKNKS